MGGFTAELIVKHAIKRMLGRPDSQWAMAQFERSIHPETKRRRREILDRAEEALANKESHESAFAYQNSTDPIVRQGYELKKDVEAKFRNSHAGLNKLRILIHVPDPFVSPGGYSLFMNFFEAFRFLGIDAAVLNWNDTTATVLGSFKPTVLMTSDSEVFLRRIDWAAVDAYRRQHPLQLGLTASLEQYGNTPLAGRLSWARQHQVSFYYAYRDEEYIAKNMEYSPFFKAGYSILPLMFGANIQSYYPVPGFVRDLNYVFLASQNGAKALRYQSHARGIISQFPGLIDGPNWSFISDFKFNSDRDRYVYARAKVGLNVHLDDQIQAANEVNERVYMLAACGVPQVCDDARLLPKLFSSGAILLAKTPEEFLSQYQSILADPEIGQRAAMQAIKEVFGRHTTFHRVEGFISALMQLFPESLR